jgi:hypothetical protein
MCVLFSLNNYAATTQSVHPVSTALSSSWDVKSVLQSVSDNKEEALISTMEAGTAAAKLKAAAATACKAPIDIVFIVFDNWGSAKLRGQLMNEALVTLNVSFARSSLVDVQTLLEGRIDKANVDIWVFVKHCRPHVADACKKHSPKSLIFLDILDNYKDEELPATGPLVDLIEGSTITGADYVLTQSKIVQGQQPTQIWYHQHTNAGPWEVKQAADVTRDVKVIGFLCGGTGTMADEKTLAAVGKMACKHSAVLRVYNQELDDNNNIDFRITDWGCEGKQVGVPHIDSGSGTGSSGAKTSRGSPSAASGLAPLAQAQMKFHQGISDVDIAFLWPPDDLVTTLYRPPTRLLYWWSHGVPTVFFPYKSYVEVSEASGYSVDSVNMSSASLPGIEAILATLATNTSVRQSLHKLGLEAARWYSTEAQALKLANIVCKEFFSSSE